MEPFHESDDVFAGVVSAQGHVGVIPLPEMKNVGLVKVSTVRELDDATSFRCCGGRGGRLRAGETDGGDEVGARLVDVVFLSSGRDERLGADDVLFVLALDGVGRDRRGRALSTRVS